MLCAVTLCLLCVSALVSGAETSFFSLSHNDIRHLQSRRSASAAAMLRLLANVDLLLATILVVNNLVNICIVILTSRSLQIKFLDGKKKYNIEYDECCNSKRKDEPCLLCCRK